MPDTKVFGRNHAMREMLGLKYDQEFEHTKNKINSSIKDILRLELSEDQLKEIIKLTNELNYNLNKRIMENGTETDSRVPSVSGRYVEERASNPAD